MGKPRSWVWQKANAYAGAWRALFGVDPTVENVALGLSVAIHETDAGDSPGWEGEHNWGAVQLRPLHADELVPLRAAGIDPPPMRPLNPAIPETFAETVARVTAQGRAALQAAIDVDGLAPEPNGALHVDSSPVHGWYWVFFARFDTDEAGAELFVRTLAARRPSCRAVLEAKGRASELATAMYATHYFEGTHDPHTIAGREDNIDDYTTAIERELVVVAPLLVGWTPGGDPGADVIDLGTAEGVQAALNALHVPGTPLDVDGELGPKSRAVVAFFQDEQNLKSDGKVGQQTRLALAVALDAEGVRYVGEDSAAVLLPRLARIFVGGVDGCLFFARKRRVEPIDLALAESAGSAPTNGRSGDRRLLRGERVQPRVGLSAHPAFEAGSIDDDG